ncbi:hypothetical protein LAZ67_4001964 [Cordylochernes scorpioides]|uniref:Reverse transcriptase domain-containing protein n=1 Tax=Cordylochernes scorpioides TaxID=51811 RepID=A0ABY6KCM0_9ARAC|nr:hypothetical protein LAZ67_4001964 [Cordylochernes scorpioides]
MSFRIASLNVRGIAVRARSVEMCCFFRQHAVDVAFVQETNVLALNNIRDLCLGYSAVFAAPGVTVLWHRVLWPGKIAIASVKIRGLETRVINCHLSHTPEERHLQLQIIAEEAIREDAWALGDINISEESSSDIRSGAVEAFAELLDRTALVDIAAIFDAAHLPTRVASYGSRVDAARLDRVLIPSRLSGRVTRYWTLNYRNSDHRAILLQVGDPPSPSAPSISALLRSAPVIERIEALLNEASQEIEGNPTGDLWGKWGKLKRELVEDIKCLYVPRVEDEDYVTRASRFLRSRLEAETVEEDYPSLPELGRALRVRQHRAELTTVFDAQGNLFEGKSLRRYVFNSFRERFNGSTCSPEDIAGFLGGATECITLEDSDPLHRADISLNEVEVAISRLPQGKGAGWDGIPCELVKGFEDFFGGVIHQVLAESKLRGTLPESSRRNIICLVPKAHGGPGLSGYRPISLPTADYRIVSGVLLGRLRRHLPAIVPDCQTYAVPGRCPSWNIACVSDEVALAFKNKTPLAVISTDLQSAFDNVDREFLASQLRTIGLPPPFMEWLHLLYAEADATIKFERVKTIFDEFRRASGVSVNFPKSKGLWCGAWRDRADSPLGISWSASSITVLGCEITSGHGTSVQENHLLGILERAISRSSPFVRGFSLVGRVRAANSLVLAAVLHHLHGYLPGLLDIRTQLQLACFKGVQAASRNGGKNAYSGLVESGAWMTPLSSGSWLLPRRRRLLDLWGQASSILGLNHRVLPAPTLLNLPLVGACRFLATPSLRAPSRWRGVCVRDLAGPAPPPIATLTRSACEDAAAPGAFCQRLVADNATSVYRERTLEEAVVLRGTATPFLRISTRTARRMLERPRLAAVPISRYLRRWAPVVDVPSTSLAFSSLRRCSFGGHATDIALRLALHALPHPGHPASSQPVCIACGSSDLSLAHRYWSCSAVRPLIREVFSIIGRPPDLQSWIFAVNLENHAITISSAAKHAIYVFFVDREMRDATALANFCNRLIEENLLGSHRADNLGEAVVLRGTVTPLMRVTTRTIRRTLERPRLATLPIAELLYRWQDFVNIPLTVGWPSLRRCAFSGHNADIAVQLALHALPHPAHPASARETCIACGSSDLTLAHRYWSCSSIRPLIREAFNIIQQPPDLQGWLFGQGLDDDALAIVASAKSSIHRFFLSLEMRGERENPLTSHGGPGLNGYRPISIPTTDYRVLSSVFLGRLRPHLPRLVPKCQTYAVPGRSSSWNIARVSDEVAAASRNNTPLAVISTDLESAFDTLDRGFLISLLVSLRLPPAFIGWLLVLYESSTS